MLNNVRIGLVGCGRWGSLILRDLKTLGCDVTVLVVSEANKQQALAGGATEIISSFDAFSKISGFVVATPTVNHYQTVRSLLPFDVPIFCEKPLTCDAAEARELADRAGGRLFVMDKWRYHAGVQALAQIAREATLGRVVGLRTTRIGWGSPHLDVDPIWILLPHDLSITLEILGKIPDPIAAQATLANGTPTGILAFLGPSPSVVMEVSVRREASRREIVLECEAGIAVLGDSYSDCIRVSRISPEDPEGAPNIEHHPIGQSLPLHEELKTFLAFLGGGQPLAAAQRKAPKSLQRSRGCA